MEQNIPKPRKPWLDIQLQSLFLGTQRALYGAVAFAILIATAMVIFDALRGFIEVFHKPDTTISHTALTAVDRLLLALMFLEILHTIQIIFGEEFHLACVEPFLLVGIIASIRRILIISLELPHGPNIVLEQFNAFMIETAVLGILVIILIFGVVLLRRSRPVRGTVH